MVGIAPLLIADTEKNQNQPGNQRKEGGRGERSEENAAGFTARVSRTDRLFGLIVVRGQHWGV